VQLLEAEPFVLIGVNSDGDAAKVREIMEREGITWRQAVDGRPPSPWARAWYVNSWPTSYLIDAEGVIRARDLRGEATKDKVMEVLAEPKGGTPAGGEPHR